MPNRADGSGRSGVRLPSWRAAVLALISFCIISGAAITPAQSDSPSEYQVKAAFLLNFAKFVDWPSSTYATPQTPFAVCVLGDDPFGSVLDNTLAGKSLGSRSVAIRRIRDFVEARRCQIVFVSSSESRHYADVVEAVRGARVLLVGETDGFASAGGAIEFTLESNHVRFAINPEAAQREGLTLSSKLLMLAHIVHDGSVRDTVAGKS